MTENSRGPLTGVRVLDLSALGPGPFASMLLADSGADVISVSRPTRAAFDPAASFSRGKRSIVVDIRVPSGTEVIRRLVAEADVFLESFRPGVMERRGLGPDTLIEINPRLVYVRLTGYGQDGPYAQRAGHDINYLSLAGTLGAIGTHEPVAPLNILGDFASGSLMAVQGVLLALLERERTGQGQVVDAAMVDGAALLTFAQFAEHGDGEWGGRGTSVLSGSAPYYGVYECADRRWFAVGAIEPQFYDQFIGALGLAEADLPDRNNQETWPDLRKIIGTAFGARNRDEWAEAFAGIDGCGSAVLELDEVRSDPHLVARGTVCQVEGGRWEPAPAPRLSTHRPRINERPAGHGADSRTVLSQIGYSEAEIDGLIADRAVVEV